MSTFFDAMRASASGLSAQRTRVNLTSSNLANAETTRGPDGQPYRRLGVVFTPVEIGGDGDSQTAGVEVASIEEDTGPFRRVFMPSHPDADEGGFVNLPNVNPIHEMVDLMGAQRSYEANASALDTTKSLAQRALDILS